MLHSIQGRLGLLGGELCKGVEEEEEKKIWREDEAYEKEEDAVDDSGLDWELSQAITSSLIGGWTTAAANDLEVADVRLGCG